MRATLLIDPSLIAGGRGRTWLLRAQRDRPGAAEIPRALLDLPDDLWPAFTTSYMSFYAAERASTWLRWFSQTHLWPIDADHNDRSVDTSISTVVTEVVESMRQGAVLAARRTELVDAVVAAGHAVIHVDASVYRQRLETLDETIGQPLRESLGRRTRFLVFHDQSAPTSTSLVLADQGAGRY